MADKGAIVGLAIEQTLDGVQADASTPLLQIPLVTYNVPTVAESLQSLTARDAKGPFSLRSQDEGEGPARVRRWFPDRAVSGTVHVRYQTTQANVTAPLGAAPPIEMRIEGDALSGGAAILALRPVVSTVQLSLSWDLSSMPGAIAADSFAGEIKQDVSPAFLDRVYLMAGKLGSQPAQRNPLGFQALWQGTPPFDPASLMQWTERLHGEYIRFFQAEPAPYTVFLRRNPVNAGGGIGMHSSFVTTFGEKGQGDDPQALKFTLAHEMFHTFQPMLASADPAEQLAGGWFNEGLAVFYQRVLPLRSGLISLDDFLRDVNYYAARYYTNALGNTPNSEVPARFWEDTRIRTLPYDRGFLYFVTVDEAVRNESGGKRSLDDLMLQMKAREQANQPVTTEVWEAAIRQEIGEAGVRSFRDMLAGAAPLPGSSAFGPCFKRVSKQLRRYELGFAPKVLTESPRKVRDLIPDSAAERAGLRNGDVITHPVPQDDVQGRQDRKLTLQILRDGVPMTIEYLPRSEYVPAWQWERVPGVADSECVR